MELSTLGGGLILFGGSQASLSSSSPEVDKGEKLVATLKTKSVMMIMIKLESQTSPCYDKDPKQGHNDCQVGWQVKERVKVLLMIELDN